MILSSGLELKKVQTAISKHLGILPKIRVGGNSARVWVKTDSSATEIFSLVYTVMWCGGSVKCIYIDMILNESSCNFFVLLQAHTIYII